jgi:acetylornithine deacetylase/succinyl-diaminopimelate desuccinylase-like protein
LKAFAENQKLKGCNITSLTDEGRPPFLIVNVDPTEATNKNCVLFYGHMDKEPFGEGWTTDPCDPVIKDGKMWGRGSVDDGYAFFSALLAIKAC